MSSNDKPTSNSPSEAEEPQLSVPEPPAPVDVGSWNIVTESEDPKPHGTVTMEWLVDKGNKK